MVDRTNRAAVKRKWRNDFLVRRLIDGADAVIDRRLRRQGLRVFERENYTRFTAATRVADGDCAKSGPGKGGGVRRMQIA